MSKFSSKLFKNTQGALDDGRPEIHGFPTKLNAGAQGKHIIGHPTYIEGRSIFGGTLEDAQKLIDIFAGKDHWQEPNKETIECTGIIGIYINKNGDTRRCTHRFTIHYSKKGAHIVPSNPERR